MLDPETVREPSDQPVSETVAKRNDAYCRSAVSWLSRIEELEARLQLLEVQQAAYGRALDAAFRAAGVEPDEGRRRHLTPVRSLTRRAGGSREWSG